MSDALHPWFAEARLTARRRLGAWRLRGGVGLLTMAALLAGAGWMMRPDDASRRLASGLATFALWPLPIGLTMIGLSYGLTRSRLLALSLQLRSGWWAAVPVDPRSPARALIVVAVAATVLAVGGLAALLTVASWFAHDSSRLGMALLVSAASLLTGVTLGTLSALRERRPRRDAGRRDGVRRPLIALTHLDDPRLPHLFDWQRREALLRWRRGGNFWLIGAALLLMPGGTAVRAVTCVMVLTVAIAWLGVVLPACADTARRADRLLRSTPVVPRVRVAAGARYPLFALTIAGGSGAIAGWLLPLPPGAALGGVAIVAALSLKPGLALLAGRHHR